MLIVLFSMSLQKESCAMVSLPQSKDIKRIILSEVF